MSFDKSNLTGEPTGARRKPDDNSQSFWSKLREKEYLYTKITLLSFLPFLLFLPVEPWMPEKNELHEFIGKPLFDPAKPWKEWSGITFSINDENLHCLFTSKGGFNGCRPFRELVTDDKPVRATYFDMKTYYGMSSKVLNSLEQDGREVVSPEELYQMRLKRFQADKEFSFIVAGMFLSWLIFVWFTDKKRMKNAMLTRKEMKLENAVPLSASHEKPISGLKVLWTKLLPKEFKSTRRAFLLFVALTYLLAPIEPWMPAESELIELVGEAHFDHIRANRASRVEFTVDGVLLYCNDRGISNTSGCANYESRLLRTAPVRATYFFEKSSYGKKFRKLNTLEQEGKVVVSAEESYRGRILASNYDKSGQKGMTIIFVISFLAFLIVDAINAIKHKRDKKRGNS